MTITGPSIWFMLGWVVHCKVMGMAENPILEQGMPAIVIDSISPALIPKLEPINFTIVPPSVDP